MISNTGFWTARRFGGRSLEVAVCIRTRSTSTRARIGSRIHIGPTGVQSGSPASVRRPLPLARLALVFGNRGNVRSHGGWRHQRQSSDRRKRCNRCRANRFGFHVGRFSGIVLQEYWHRPINRIPFQRRPANDSRTRRHTDRKPLLSGTALEMLQASSKPFGR